VKQLSITCAFVFAAILSSACSTNSVQETVGSAISGRVMDRESGLPIADAIVFVRWRLHRYESALIQMCVHMDMARTDAGGHYSIPGFRKPSAAAVNETSPWKISPWIEVYQPGYGRDRDFRPLSTTLPRWSGTADERMVLLAILQGQSTCEGASTERSHAVRAEIQQALLQEAESLAALRPESQRMLNELRAAVYNQSKRSSP
jgi:hypothetical protein